VNAPLGKEGFEGEFSSGSAGERNHNSAHNQMNYGSIDETIQQRMIDAKGETSARCIVDSGSCSGDQEMEEQGNCRCLFLSFKRKAPERSAGDGL